MYKVALINICLNQPYWQYYQPMIDSAKKFFLKGHEVDFITWSDMPNGMTDATVIPTEPFDWPLPTLYRYHLFLREEELLQKYDYIFYCDADMEFVSPVGDEVLGDITAAQHPMYALDRKYVPPYEPNPTSASYIPRPGRILTNGKTKRFEPLYYAGGFQGGRSDEWIKAMKKMKELIDKDFTENYIPVWNDESAWNKYLFENPPTVVLSPSYIYPDSLISAYYKKIWGRNYVPKLVTVTKKFSTSEEAGLKTQEKLRNM